MRYVVIAFEGAAQDMRLVEKRGAESMASACGILAHFVEDYDFVVVNDTTTQHDVIKASRHGITQGT